MELRINSMLKFHHTRTEHPAELHFEMHAHSAYELFYLVEGRGTFWVEGSEYSLHAGDMMMFNISEVHHIDVDPTEPYERIVVNFRGELFDDVPDGAALLEPFCGHISGHGNRLRPEDFPDTYWQRCLLRLAQESEQQGLQTYSNLLPICNEIRLAYAKIRPAVLPQDTLPRQIIAYINDNLHTLHGVEQITEQFHVSRSALYALFRRVTGSSVWEYITVKRLMEAKRLLNDGELPTAVYLQCGFRDYTTFFRAYKRQFGISPGKDCIK